jgi:hypothetical protein
MDIFYINAYLQHHEIPQQNIHHQLFAYDPETSLPKRLAIEQHGKKNLQDACKYKNFHTFKSCQEAEEGSPRTITVSQTQICMTAINVQLKQTK